MDLGNVAPATGAEWIGSVPHEAMKRGVRPLLPRDDPFYDPPLGFQHAAPGTVLRSRDVEVAFLGLIPQKMTATQLLYRTTDMNGAPESVVSPAMRKYTSADTHSGSGGHGPRTPHGEVASALRRMNMGEEAVTAFQALVRLPRAWGAKAHTDQWR